MTGTKRRTQKLGQHTLCYVSKFRRYGVRSSSVIVILKPQNIILTQNIHVHAFSFRWH